MNVPTPRAARSPRTRWRPGLFLSLAGAATPLDVFDGVAESFAQLFGTSVEMGGFVAGAAATFGLFLVCVILVSRMQQGGIAAVAGGLLVGAIFSALVGWWPLWTVYIAGFFMAVIIASPFLQGGGGRASGGMG